MSVIDVSVMAGEILLALERSGGAARVEQMTLHRPCSRDVLLMALGWLFKEGLVTVQPGIGDWLITAHTRGV